MSQRPRVLLHAFSTFQLGGPQARFVQLANALGPAYEHHIVAMDNRFDAGDRLGPQVRWQPVPMAIKKGGLLANRSACRQQLQRLKPDLLLSYNWGAIEWAAANLPRLVPQVHVEDGFGPEEANTQLPRRVWTRRALLGLGRVPLVVASRRLERLAVQAWRLPAKRVLFVANGVEVSETTRQPNELPSLADGVLRIGTVAGLRPEKNIARLIRAFASLRQKHSARLIVVGGGAELPALESLAGQLGVRSHIEFTGYLREPSGRLREMDIFALSSDTEQLPIALLEALSVGMPVVATRVGDVGDILSDVSPQTLCVPDDEAFTRALHTAVEQRAQWPQWEQAGREKVSAIYSAQQMLASWKSLFDGDSFHLVSSRRHVLASTGLK